VPPSSATSSRASSPRSGISAQPSLSTLSMNRTAQYRRKPQGRRPPLVDMCELLPCLAQRACRAPVLLVLQPPPASSGPTPSRARGSPPAMWWHSAPRHARPLLWLATSMPCLPVLRARPCRTCRQLLPAHLARRCPQLGQPRAAAHKHPPLPRPPHRASC
jgi:hypothetical protein